MTQLRLYYDVEFDLTNRVLTVWLDREEFEDVDEVTSEDGSSVVVFRLGRDDLPYVTKVTLKDDRYFSLMRDWIESGIEKGMHSLDVFRTDDHADDHWKGVMVDVEAVSDSGLPVEPRQ